MVNYFAVFEQLGLKGVPNVFKMRAPPYKASLDLLENTVESVFDLQMGWRGCLLFLRSVSCTGL